MKVRLDQNSRPVNRMQPLRNLYGKKKKKAVTLVFGLTLTAFS